MKLPKKTTKKTPLIIALIIAVVAIAAVVVFYFVTQQNKSNQSQASDTRGTNQVDYNPPTQEEISAADENKKAITENEKNSSSNSGSAGEIALSISQAYQADLGEPLVVRAVITGTSTGSCDITLTKSGQTVAKTAEISFEATHSTCGTNIPADEFGAGGMWQLKVVAKNNNKTSNIAEQEVEIAK